MAFWILLTVGGLILLFLGLVVWAAMFLTGLYFAVKLAVYWALVEAGRSR